MLYEKARQLFGQEDIELPTYTRPWIVPGEVIVRESPSGAFIYKATLKVMLEQDYLSCQAIDLIAASPQGLLTSGHEKGALAYGFNDPRIEELNAYSSQLVRELIIPQLTRQVNSSKRYASLRQVFYSLILAQWFKSKNPDNPAIDRKDLNGLASVAPWSKDAYFNGYKNLFRRRILQRGGH